VDTCTGSTLVLAGECDGAGPACAQPTEECAPFACGASACLEACTTDADCAGGNVCVTGACMPAVPTRTRDGGCGCVVAGAARSGAPAWLALLVLAPVLLRARRRLGPR
jgi:MYXO-CTERM domain-containing protein